MNKLQIKIHIKYFESKKTLKRRVIFIGFILSLIVMASIMVIARDYVSDVSLKNRKKALVNVVKVLDNALNETILEVVSQDYGLNSCPQERVASLVALVQKNPYLRSVTFFDKRGNIYCSSSRGDVFVEHKYVSQSVKNDIYDAANRINRNIEVKMIEGSTVVPNKKAMVIIIPVKTGVITAAIDALNITKSYDYYNLLGEYKYTLAPSNFNYNNTSQEPSKTSSHTKLNLASSRFHYQMTETVSMEKNHPGHAILLTVIFMIGFAMLNILFICLISLFFSQKKFLKKLILKKTFSFLIQPAYSLNKKELIGGEVLARLYIDNEYSVSPSVFIPLCEEYELVNLLSVYLIKDVADKLCQGIIVININFKMSFNIHASHFEDESLIDACDYFISRTKGQVKLSLELTERQDLKFNTNSINIINKLRMLGVGIAVDDFGTGSSGLKYLSNHSFEIIKIDKSLLDDAFVNPHASFILESVMRTIQTLHKKIYVEGVEKEEHISFLKKLNLEQDIFIQGYLWSKPVMIKEFNKLLSDSN